MTSLTTSRARRLADTAVTAPAADPAADPDRGRYLLAVAAAVANLHHDNIIDLLLPVLDSDAWRSYTTPDGSHYQFRAREFDYFLAQVRIDPHLVSDAARHADPATQVRLVEATLPTVGPDRRAIDDITASYHDLTPILTSRRPVRLGPTLMYRSANYRARRSAGQSPHAAQRRRDWNVAVHGDTPLAEAIVAKLNRSPDLRRDVLTRLQST